MKTSAVTVRFADRKDIDRIVEIERSWIHLSHWSVDAYHRLLEDDALTTSLVAETERLDRPRGRRASGRRHIVGFVIFHATDSTAEIYNIAVEREHARLGVGSALMNGVIDLSRGDGVRKLSLEVRKSNANAISFYQEFKFRITGERMNYYSSPQEDAYVMEKDLRIP
jgi:ribosomal-protein-alanine N-acetyltransferase